MAASYDSLRLRNQRAMDRRLTADHRQLARVLAGLVLRAATNRDEAGQPIIPPSRKALDDLKAAAWERVLKPYYVGNGTDALDGPNPRSPYALLLVEGIAQATRIQAERQAALVRRLVKDPEVVRWLTGPRPMLPTREMQPTIAGRITELTLTPTRDTQAGLRGVDGRIDTERARAALVRPRGTYDAFHQWVDPNGYRLSDRIWRTGIDVRSRIDLLLDYEVARGTGAVTIANMLEPFLTPGGTASKTVKPYGREGSFSARRLARTEITAAAGRATVNAAAANPFVAQLQWRLSPSHPKIDRCDDHARGGPNGDGIYDIDKLPRYPDHPHCLCSILPVPTGSTADLVQTLRADIQAARGNLIDAASGGDPARARALQGTLSPEYLTQAMMTGNLDDAVAQAVRQAQTVRPVVPRVAPPVKPSVPPMGTPVSTVLQPPTKGKISAPVKEAIGAIDTVHGDGQLDALPIKGSATSSRAGSYSFYGRRFQGKQKDIKISTTGDHPRMTMAHEVGHWLDHQQLNIAWEPNRTNRANTEGAIAFRAAINESAAVKRLREMYSGPLQTDVDGRPLFLDRGYLRTVLRDDELWARSYAQYIAKRSGNPAILEELATMRESIYPTQWSDDDFEPIANAIDKIMAEKGWRQ